MTKLGVVARADNTGIGTQSWELCRHMKPYKTMIVDFSGQSSSGKDLTIYPDRFENYHIVSGIPPKHELDDFLEDLDVVFCIETPYNQGLFERARSLGIKTILQPNWEFLAYLEGDLAQWMDLVPDVLAFPSLWHYEDALVKFDGLCSVEYLPVPIAVDRWGVSSLKTPARAKRFLHVVGHQAVFDRNGTLSLMDAIRHIKSDVRIDVRSLSGNVKQWIDYCSDIPHNVELNFLSDPVENYWELYDTYDALIMPRRYGGLCLPINEIIGAGRPVIVPNISPNNKWLPPEFLVGANYRGAFMSKTHVDVYDTDIIELAERIDLWATDTAAYNTAVDMAAKLSVEYSWSRRKIEYEEIIQ